MATPIRKKSASGFYHVVQRGVNRFDIFEDDDDRSFFMAILSKTAQLNGAKIYAWCLMSNHVHLLLSSGYKELSSMMRQLGSIYAKRFNRRHGRSGPLFEGRFRSVCVETEAQLIAVARYIHRNPITHEESTLLGDYKWSSYGDYLNGEDEACDTEFILGLLGGVSEFIRIHEEEWPYERHLDIGATGRMSDDEARRIADIVLMRAGVDVHVAHVGALARKLRDEAIILVKKTVGCSLRQLQRLTAVSYSAICRAVGVSDASGHSFLEPDCQPNPILLFAGGERLSSCFEAVGDQGYALAHDGVGAF